MTAAISDLPRTDHAAATEYADLEHRNPGPSPRDGFGIPASLRLVGVVWQTQDFAIRGEGSAFECWDAILPHFHAIAHVQPMSR